LPVHQGMLYEANGVVIKCTCIRNIPGLLALHVQRQRNR